MKKRKRLARAGGGTPIAGDKPSSPHSPYGDGPVERRLVRSRSSRVQFCDSAEHGLQLDGKGSRDGLVHSVLPEVSNDSLGEDDDESLPDGHGTQLPRAESMISGSSVPMHFLPSAKLRHWLHGEGFAVLTAKGTRRPYLVGFRRGFSLWFSQADLEEDLLLNRQPSGCAWTSSRADLASALEDGSRLFHIWFGIGTVIEVCLSRAWHVRASVSTGACVCARARVCARGLACVRACVCTPPPSPCSLPAPSTIIDPRKPLVSKGALLCGLCRSQSIRCWRTCSRRCGCT
jgi:hypothetical protein